MTELVIGDTALYAYYAGLLCGNKTGAVTRMKISDIALTWSATAENATTDWDLVMGRIFTFPSFAGDTRTVGIITLMNGDDEIVQAIDISSADPALTWPPGNQLHIGLNNYISTPRYEVT